MSLEVEQVEEEYEELKDPEGDFEKLLSSGTLPFVVKNMVSIIGVKTSASKIKSTSVFFEVFSQTSVSSRYSLRLKLTRILCCHADGVSRGIQAKRRGNKSEAEEG